MLPPHHRMRRRDEFTSAVRRGRRAGRPTLVVHLLRPDASEQDTSPDLRSVAADVDPRVGFIVARTVGNAVIRNRVQRRLRQEMREHVHRLPPGSLLVVRASPAAGMAHHSELAADLESAIDRLLRPATRPTSRGRR